MERDDIVPGACLGRYTIRGRLGGGGMGDVFVAHDPELDRLVALKVVRSELAARSPEARARFQREAQALARLNHPNVVAVYDVDLAGDRVFVTMELIDGPTLAAWLAEEPRTAREIIEVFLAAGRGLAAAHAAGLVHRDFKPSNVMLGDRVRVVDFGLARLASTEDDPISGLSAAPILDGTITHTGEALGTPAYMAPEQRLGDQATALSDQYAFAVALHEALLGVRPGQPMPAAPPRTITKRLRALLDRALNTDPAQRYTSMQALLDVLAHDPARARRRWLLAGGALASAGLAATVVVALRPGAATCDVGEIDAVWTPARRAQIASLFAAREVRQVERITSALDAWTERWRLARITACRDPDTAAVARGECLDRARAQLALTVAGLAGGTPTMVDRGLELVLDLPAPETCLSVSVADTLPYPNDPRVAQVLHDLDVARIAEDSMSFADGRAASGRALATARELGHPALLAEALAYEVRLGPERTEAKRAEQLDLALSEATRARDRHLQAMITLRILERAVAGDDLKATAAMLPIARAAVVASEDPAHARALVRFEARYLARSNQVEQALAACARLAALDPASSFAADDCRCQTYLLAFQYGPAKAACTAALASAEESYGTETTVTVNVLHNLAVVEAQLGDVERSRALRERRKEIVATVYGRESGQMATTIYGLGTLSLTAGDAERARREITQAIEIWTRLPSPPASSISTARMLLAELHGALGDPATGADEADRALALSEQALGAKDSEMVMLLLKHGYANLGAGRTEVALASFTRSAELAEATYGATHLLVGLALLSRAQVLIESGRASEALAPAERAASIVSAAETSPGNKAAAHAALGHARLLTGDRAGGRAELLLAQKLFGTGPGAQRNLETIAKLLRAHAR